MKIFQYFEIGIAHQGWLSNPTSLLRFWRNGQKTRSFSWIKIIENPEFCPDESACYVRKFVEVRVI